MVFPTLKLCKCSIFFLQLLCLIFLGYTFDATKISSCIQYEKTSVTTLCLQIGNQLSKPHVLNNLFFLSEMSHL